VRAWRLDEARAKTWIAQEIEEHARRDGRIGEVREQAVHPQLVELQILVDRNIAVVGSQAARLVAEGPGVDEQSTRVRALDDVGRR